MPHGSNYPDPGIEHGSFKVLPRTDGRWIVIDVRRKPGYRTVGKPFRTMQDAALAAKAWSEAGHG